MPTDRLVTLRTERLLVRAATLQDVELYYALWTNPSEMGFRADWDQMQTGSVGTKA